MNYIFADGNWLTHRAFSVYAKSSSVPEKKIPNAVLDWFCSGAVRFQCTGGAICFDGPDIFRHKVYKGYKETRTTKKEEAARKRFDEGLPPEPTAGAYIAPTIELFRSHGLLAVQDPELEADDLLISAGTTFGKDKPSNLVILEARDKDLFQGVKPNVRIYTPAMGTEKEIIWTPERVLAKKGLTPSQFLKYQILRGDATDDIPPIPEIGSHGKAMAIVKEYAKLTDYFMTPKGRKMFAKYKSELHRNRQLVSMVRNAWTIKNVDFKLIGSAPRSPSFAALKSSLSKKSLF
jgi:5'-3' exonuclease